MSNLNKKNAERIFSHGETKEFFMKGGTELKSSNKTLEADANRSFIANKILANNGQGWRGNAYEADADKPYYTNQAKSKGQWLGSGQFFNEDANIAYRAMSAAEQEYIAAQMIQNNKTQSR